MKTFNIIILVICLAALPSCLMHSSEQPDGTSAKASENLTESPYLSEASRETESTEFCESAKESDSEIFDTEADTARKPDTENAENEIPSPASILSSMTTEEKVGQLFLARNPKTEEEGIALIESMQVGGIIFFARDFRNSTPEKFTALMEKYNEKSNIPIFTAVDEEGGSVCRISHYESFRAEKFLSPSELYLLGGMEEIRKDTLEKSEFLLSLGINFNLAPVADISESPEDFIYERTIGKGKNEAAEYVKTVVTAMNEKGILSALKHFPGYGGNADTHTGTSHDKRSPEELRSSDFIPFISGIEAGAAAVMVSHNIVEGIDADFPASLSGKVISILRDELSFDGIVITDDLSMGAIKEFAESGEAAVLAVLAGADLICSSDTEKQYTAVLKAAKEGRISEERLDESVFRLLCAKEGYGIIKGKVPFR